MKVVVVNAFERGNRGDAALLTVAIQQLREAFPGAEISIAGCEDPDRWPTFEGVPNLGSIRRYVGDRTSRRCVRIRRKAVAAAVAAAVAVPGSTRLLRPLSAMLPVEMRNEVHALSTADLVVSLGGGYLNARATLAADLSIAFLLFPLWIAQRLGVPVILAPQSFGPFPHWQQRMIVRQVLNASSAIVAREAISVSMLEGIGIRTRRIVRGADGAFTFRGRSTRRWRHDLGITASTTLVLVTVRRFLDQPHQQTYEDTMASAIRHILVDPACTVILVPQVTCTDPDDDDGLVNDRIAATIDDPRLMSLRGNGLDHHDLFALYGSADFIIGTRFHSVIFGLCSGVPCVAIEYDHKTRGIMEDLGLRRWVIHMTEASPERLIPLIDTMMAEGETYRRHLAAVLPAYSRRAAEFVDVLRATTSSRLPAASTFQASADASSGVPCPSPRTGP